MSNNKEMEEGVEKEELQNEEEFPIIRKTILTKLKEHANLKVGDENPETTVYFVFDGDRPIGGLEISNVSGKPMDDTASIIEFKTAPEEKPLKVIRDAIPLVFRKMPTVNTLLLPSNPMNRDFWEKAGANRIKSGVHAFQRGH